MQMFGWAASFSERRPKNLRGPLPARRPPAALALRRLHDERARAAHLLVEQADGVRFQIVRAEGIRADQLRAAPVLCASVMRAGRIS